MKMNLGFKKNKSNKKGGFTLVEVIVVLVILAILAAFLVPSFTTYIDKANDRAAVAEARKLLTGLQVVASEQYAINKTNIRGVFLNSNNMKEAKALAQVDENIEVLNVMVSSDGIITNFSCNIGKRTKKTVEYIYDRSEKFKVLT